jgi:aryl-alcohol dehydrogenase-like predicted oxidoreductase
VGVTKLAQLDDAAGAVSVALSGEEVASLEEAYRPHATSFIK